MSDILSVCSDTVLNLGRSVRALLPHAIHLSGQSDGPSDELNLPLLQHKHHVPPHLLASSDHMSLR